MLQSIWGQFPYIKDKKQGMMGMIKLKNLYDKNYAEHETGRLVPDLFLFFKKA